MISKKDTGAISKENNENREYFHEESIQCDCHTRAAYRHGEGHKLVGRGKWIKWYVTCALDACIEVFSTPWLIGLTFDTQMLSPIPTKVYCWAQIMIS